MPIATASPEETTRHDLKSAPPDGFVVLRSMTYGEWLHRRDMATKMAIEGDPRKKDSKVTIDTIQTETTLYEFSKCVVEHNLTDVSDKPLNLGNRSDFSRLHPKVGEEISSFIADMNAWEADQEDLFTESEPASS